MNMDHRTKLATVLALAMHLAGLAGLMSGLDEAFRQLTPFNLMAMFGLILYTRPNEQVRKFLIFLSIAFILGFSAEMVGVKTGMLFGNYSYGTALGPKVNSVPLLIGINWFIVVYGSGMLAVQIRMYLGRLIPAKAAFSRWIGFSVIIDGALFATLFDLIMEPAATKLGLWTWQGGQVPMLNYVTWFLLSVIIMAIFRQLKLKHHPFAMNLLLIQALFFLMIGFKD